MTTRPPYTYRKLFDPLDKRVLVLHPAGYLSDPLVADLEHWTHLPESLLRADKLEDEYSNEDWFYLQKYQQVTSRYTAVSYAWGHACGTKPLYIGTGEHQTALEISVNVHEMLGYLRLSDASVTLWIDAICINQIDITEKETQVQRMGDIYAQAESVMIWLGSEREWAVGESRAFNLLSQIQVCESQKEARSKVQNSVHSIEKLLERAWFYRRWIIQEVALAKTATIVYGHHRNRFEGFVKGPAVVVSSYNVKHHTTDITEKLQLMLSIQDSCRSLKSNNYLGKLTPTPPIPILLSIFHSAQCSDDRDRLYALRSLSKMENFQVSYTAPVEKVFYQFSMQQAMFNAEFLGVGAAFRSSAHVAPSWVADWREPPRHLPISATARFRDSTSMVRRGGAFASRKAAFRLTGMIAGTITKIVDRGEEEDVGTLLRWHALYRQSQRTKCPKFRSDNFHSTIGMTFFETLSLGQLALPPIVFLANPDYIHFSLLLNGRRPTLKNHLIAQLCPPSPYPRPRLFPRFKDFVSPSWPRLYHEQAVVKRDPRDLGWNNREGRCAFVTDAGDFGLGPAGAEPGNVVVRISDSRIPLVLHRTTKRSGSMGVWAPFCGNHEYLVGDEDMNLDGECWSVVGDCYVTRFMENAVALEEDGMREFRLI